MALEGLYSTALDRMSLVALVCGCVLCLGLCGIIYGCNMEPPRSKTSPPRKTFLEQIFGTEEEQQHRADEEARRVANDRTLRRRIGLVDYVMGSQLDYGHRNIFMHHTFFTLSADEQMEVIRTIEPLIDQMSEVPARTFYTYSRGWPYQSDSFHVKRDGNDYVRGR